MTRLDLGREREVQEGERGRRSQALTGTVARLRPSTQLPGLQLLLVGLLAHQPALPEW